MKASRDVKGPGRLRQGRIPAAHGQSEPLSPASIIVPHLVRYSHEGRGRKPRASLVIASLRGQGYGGILECNIMCELEAS